MSRYIEFTTSHELLYMAGSLGNPVHDGSSPTRFKEVLGVRVDGVPVEFSDDTIPERINKALVNGRYLRPDGSFKCVAFVALMHGLEPHGPIQEEDASFVITREEVQVGPLDRPSMPVDLAAEDPNTSLLSYEHMIYPAHTAEQSQYVHKIGRGPLCLSGLEDALRISRLTIAHPITLFEIK